MTELSPITPPPEFIEEWIELSRPQKNRSPNPNVLATYAARWGADTELEACFEWLNLYAADVYARDLRIARRPKPPSLKEQALAALERWAEDEHGPGAVFHKGLEVGLIRRALEALDD